METKITSGPQGPMQEHVDAVNRERCESRKPFDGQASAGVVLRQIGILEHLQLRIKEAEQQAAHYRTLLRMLPTVPTPEQDYALRQLIR